MSKILNNDFQNLVVEIKQKIQSHQYNALKAVNKELITLYREIGQSIVSRQNELGWGKSVVENLSQELQNEFVGIKGFSYRNLINMKSFYIAYCDNSKLQALSAELSWSHNIAIIQKCDDDLEREFYIKSAIKNSWSYRVLDNQIANKTYEKFLLNQNNFENTLPTTMQTDASLILKDDYSFDFLELADKHHERELEAGLINSIREFLSQMGADFSFIGNQYKLEVDGEEYFIDMLLYHRRLKSLIAIELKIGKFKPEYAGKMSFYLSALNNKIKLDDESPSIGIIICKEKSRTTVEYALKDSNQPIGVSTYSINHNLPKDLEKLLPSPQEISQRLEGLMK